MTAPYGLSGEENVGTRYIGLNGYWAPETWRLIPVSDPGLPGAGVDTEEVSHLWWVSPRSHSDTTDKLTGTISDQQGSRYLTKHIQRSMINKVAAFLIA